MRASRNIFAILGSWVTMAGVCAAQADTSAAPTFHKNIEPILQKHCQECHRPGEAGPMPLLTYSQTRPWAKAIRSAVLSGKMPPWHADSHSGKFSNDLSLAPRRKGNAGRVDRRGALRRAELADAPKPRSSRRGGGFRNPTSCSKCRRSSRSRPRASIDYQYFPVATNFTEDKWVEAVEVRPGDRVGRASRHRGDGVARRLLIAGLSGGLRAGHGAAGMETGAGAADQGRVASDFPDALHGERQAGARPDEDRPGVREKTGN